MPKFRKGGPYGYGEPDYGETEFEGPGAWHGHGHGRGLHVYHHFVMPGRGFRPWHRHGPHAYGPHAPTREQELDALKQKAEWLKEKLDAIQSRIQELEKSE